MGLTSRRLTATVLVAALAFAGACGSDDDDGGDAADTTTTTAAASTTAADEGAGPTTTAGDDGDEATSTTTTDGDEGPDGPDGDATTVPDTSQQPDEGGGAPDEEAPNVDWELDATTYRGQDGRRVAFLCPPDGDTSSSVWGSDLYTDDSSVCVAAVHQGIVNPVEGGRVVIEIAPGEEAYTGSTANSIASQDYGSWSGSFTFPPA